MASARRGAVTSRVEDLLVRAVAAGMFPGAVAAWQVGEGPRRVVTVGAAALRPGRQPARATTCYDLASLTKPLATTTVFLLAGRTGRVGLGTQVAEILPEASGAPLGGTTVAELLAHTSGLPAWAPLYALAAEPGPPVLEALLQLPLAGRGRVVYSDLGFVVLGLLLERLLDEPLGVAFARRVASSVDATGFFGFCPDPSSVELAGGAASPSVEHALTRAAGYPEDLVPGTVTGLPDDGNARMLGGAAGHAGLFGSADAVLTLARHYLPGAGGLLSDAEIRTVTRAASPPGPLVRSAGWQLAASLGSSAGPALAPASWGHTGFTGPSLWVDPTRRAALVLLTNRHHPAHRGTDLHPLRRRFHALVLGDARSR